MEIESSTYKEGRVDTPLSSVKFLKRFLIQNEKLLKTINVRNLETNDNFNIKYFSS